MPRGTRRRPKPTPAPSPTAPAADESAVRLTGGPRYPRRITLKDLPPLLRRHPALAGLAGASSAVLAVPDAARAFTIAGLAQLSDRHPVVVAMPTSTDAERLTA